LHEERAASGNFHPEGVVSLLAQGFNLGPGHPRWRALNGRQIESPNKMEVGVNGLIVGRPMATLIFARRFIW
jgi:hypothetical protein